MTKSPQRAHHASKPKSATRQRENGTRTSEPLKASNGDAGIPVTDYEPTDITPEQFFKAWSRKDRAALIEALIDTLDAETGDADFEETGDDELSLGFLECFTGSGRIGNVFCTDDREVEDEHDEDTCDREDVCEDEGAEHDGSEPDEEGEPSLGWTVDGAIANGDGGMDREAGGSCVTEAMRQRYKPFDRYSANGNRDGKHVDAERGFGVASRRLTNLSDRQRMIVEPRLNDEEVWLS